MVAGLLFSRRFLFVCCFLTAVSGLGCSSSEQPIDISGTVTFKGNLVPDGEIRFDPDAKEKFDGIQGYARIKNGKFDTAQDGRGILPGPYVIRILACDGKPASELPLGTPLRSEYKFREKIDSSTTELKIEIPQE